MSYVERTLEKVLPLQDKKRAFVIYGSRQVGKTTLIEHLAEGREAQFLSGDYSSDVALLRDESATPMLLSREFLVIDEAQKVPDIGLIIKRLVDRRSGCTIMVTGSSSLRLSGGVRESAVGRTDSYRLWPLSLSEIATASSWVEVQRTISDRMIYGCYPAVVTETKPEKRLQEILDGYLFKDIFELAGVRKSTPFMNLVTLLAQSVGSEVTYEGLGKRSGLSKATVIGYIDLLEQCFIVKRLPSFSRSVATELRKGKKIYFVDTGIRNAVLGDFSPLTNRADRGALWENLFVMERIKLHDYAEDGARAFFWRTAGKKEIDFLEERNGQLTAFECKFSKGGKKDARVPLVFARAYPGSRFAVVSPMDAFKVLDSAVESFSRPVGEADS
ncbi:MAG: ATP-binding protein [Sutterellaceae bacterium]|nr:ATP-binding protein [Sutterellaceae bacterium]MDD7442899.1 ATP-binding protein [Sutterellaceae bacterium]MDY2868159.1 ATP-binding protein [Mesosutterella sp.]